MDNATFEEQLNSFTSRGYAHDPSLGSNRLIGSSGNKPSKRKSRGEKKEKKNFNAGDLDGFQGPWAKKSWETEAKELTDEQKQHLEETAAKKVKQEEESKNVETETSELHVEEKDYQGRTYMYIPPEFDHLPPEKNYVPKKCLHTWKGHTKGVSAIRFFPKSGHMLLSASMDSTVKLWSVTGQRKCLRTFSGHEKAIRDVTFNSDGSRFATVSYDKYLKIWDTEYGKCISRHTTNVAPYCVKFNPNNENEVLVGQQNKKIVQWDLSTNEVAQEYDEHLGAVNTVTFVEGGERFVTTSDDKKVFVWEYGIPVVIKHIAEPDMHSMPAVELHPNGKWLIGQSQDNQILVYGASKGYKLNKKKRFRGHFNAGYACQLGFSPDGKFVLSGDGEGRCFFWDWKTGKLIKKLKCHDQVTIGAAWHPLETSKVATCSWDGNIKYWD